MKVPFLAQALAHGSRTFLRTPPAAVFLPPIRAVAKCALASFLAPVFVPALALVLALSSPPTGGWFFFLPSPAAAQSLGGGSSLVSGVPLPVINGDCLIGSGGKPIWGSCSGSPNAVQSVTGTAGQITAAPTTGAVNLALPSTITANLTFSGTINHTGPFQINGTGLSFPASNMVGITDSQSLSNKTINCASNTCTVRANLDLTGTLAATNFPALTGDVTTSAGALSTTVANSAITNVKIGPGAVSYSKIQNETSGTLLGNASGSPAPPQEIGMGTGCSLSGGVLTCSGGGGSGGIGSSTNGQVLFNNNGGVGGFTIGGALTSAGGTLDVATGGINSGRIAAGAASANIGNLGGVLSGTLPNPSFATGAVSAAVGTLGGVLSGTLPNPGMAVGAAATNVGALGGALTGSLPNPGLLPGIAAANVGNLGGVLGGQLPNPTMAGGAASANVGTLGADLSGTLPNPKVKGIQGVAVSATAPTSGQVLAYNSSNLDYEPSSVVSGINQLTGDVTTPVGSGAQPATLTATGMTANRFNVTDTAGSPFCISFDTKGRATGAASGTCSGVGTTHFFLLEAGGKITLEAGGSLLCETC
jgi:hypothetical protein